MIDTHTHIYNDTDGGDGAMQRAIASGITHLVFPNIDIASVRPIRELHAMYPYNSSTAMGLHPTELGEDWRSTLRTIENEWGECPIVAIGEVGIDLYWDKSREKEQCEAFAYQLDMAGERKLPVIIHSREAFPATLKVLLEHADRCGDIPPLLFHSFTGTPEDAANIIKYFPDAMFGFNGVATYKNASEVRDAAKLLGVQRIVLETDSPYLAPVPMRGKRNESSYLHYILESLSSTLNIDAKELEKATDINARKIFNLEH